jgi:hypothetical protein
LLLLLPMLLHSFAYMQVSEESQVCSVFPWFPFWFIVIFPLTVSWSLLLIFPCISSLWKLNSNALLHVLVLPGLFTWSDYSHSIQLISGFSVFSKSAIPNFSLRVFLTVVCLLHILYLLGDFCMHLSL